jgi:hypothetical protein
MKKTAVYALVLFTILLSACASGPYFQQAPPPPSGKALIYLYRLDTWPEFNSRAYFDINNTNVAALSANSYTWIYLPEGNYRLEQRLDLRGEAVLDRDFSARAGSTYYFRLNVETGAREVGRRLANVTAFAPVQEISNCRFQPPND